MPASLRCRPPVTLVIAILMKLVSFSLATETCKFLPSNDIESADWRRDHPEWAGSGVVVAILDTSVDHGVPDVETTTTVLVKVIDVCEFSTVGDWSTDAAEWDAEQGVCRAEDGLQPRNASRPSSGRMSVEFVPSMADHRWERQDLARISRAAGEPCTRTTSDCTPTRFP